MHHCPPDVLPAFLQRDVSTIKSTTLTQFLLNWTLAEVADLYRPSTTVPEGPGFDVTNVEDWYQHVVIPLLLTFLPDGADLMHQNITLAFHQVLYVDTQNSFIFSIYYYFLFNGCSPQLSYRNVTAMTC